MDKIKAMEKARACLAIANDKGAYPEEKKNALEMAKKLAEKYGFSIGQVPQGTSKGPSFTRPDYEGSYIPQWGIRFTGNVRMDMINLICNILRREGYKDIEGWKHKIQGQKNEYSIKYRNKVNINEQINTLYKNLNKICKRVRKETTWDTEYFCHRVFEEYVTGWNRCDWFFREAEAAIRNFRGTVG